MKQRQHIAKDLLWIGVSVVAAFFIVRVGFVDYLLTLTEGSLVISSFVAGFFFTSVFTTIPAVSVLGQLAYHNDMLLVAVVGALGAVCGDFILFRFLRDSLADDLAYIVQLSGGQQFLAIFRLRLFRWFVPLIGGLVIASPLPDELGLAMLGLSRTRTSLFFLTSLVCNFAGIVIIGLVAKGFF